MYFRSKFSDLVNAVFSGHSSAVCDLQSVGSRMVSSDDIGNIVLWQAGADRCKQILKIPGSGLVSPVSGSICFDVIVMRQ